MIIYGKQLFLHLLNKKPQSIEEIYLAKECDKKLFSQMRSLKVDIKKLDFKKAQALAKGGNHQGFFAKIKPLEFVNLYTLKDAKFLLMLYGLSDVGNIGAICRSAYIFGADGLIIAGLKSINLEGILRTSSGAALELPICFCQDGLSAINELKQSNFCIYASDMSGTDIREVDKKEEKKVLIVGSEGFGIPQKALSKCDKKIKINMVRDFNSLNVSAASAILCDRIVNE